MRTFELIADTDVAQARRQSIEVCHTGAAVSPRFVQYATRISRFQGSEAVGHGHGLVQRLLQIWMHGTIVQDTDNRRLHLCQQMPILSVTVELTANVVLIPRPIKACFWRNDGHPTLAEAKRPANQLRFQFDDAWSGYCRPPNTTRITPDRAEPLKHGPNKAGFEAKSQIELADTLDIPPGRVTKSPTTPQARGAVHPLTALAASDAHPSAARRALRPPTSINERAGRAGFHPGEDLFRLPDRCPPPDPALERRHITTSSRATFILLRCSPRSHAIPYSSSLAPCLYPANLPPSHVMLCSRLLPLVPHSAPRPAKLSV